MYSDCVFCGTSFLQNKKGRKKDYCTKECQITNKYYNLFRDNVENISFTFSKKKILKGDLFSLVSSLHND